MGRKSGSAAGKSARPFIVPAHQRHVVEEFIECAIEALKLSHWTIRVDWSKRCEKGALATISEESDSKHATIRLSPEFFALPRRDRHQALLHELMHCHVFEVQRLAEDTVALLGSKRESAVFGIAYTSAVERLVDGMADTLLDLLEDRRLHVSFSLDS